MLALICSGEIFESRPPHPVVMVALVTAASLWGRCCVTERVIGTHMFAEHFANRELLLFLHGVGDPAHTPLLAAWIENNPPPGAACLDHFAIFYPPPHKTKHRLCGTLRRLNFQLPGSTLIQPTKRTGGTETRWGAATMEQSVVSAHGVVSL